MHIFARTVFFKINDRFHIMKYKKGGIVEVLTTNDVPCNSWRCAQIVSGNGHTYAVRYDVYPGFTNQGNVERVSRKVIRPCPPLVEILECWQGDVVEVFHNLSWKMAIVSKVFSWDLFLVRLVGSFVEFEASKAELRVRQSWQNDEWIVIGKVNINSKDGLCNKVINRDINSSSQEKQRNAKGNSYKKSLQLGTQNDNLQESLIVSTRTLKRGSPYCFSQDEVNGETSLRFKITQKDGKRPREIIADVAREDDENSVTCSVGSCSIYENSRFEDIESHDSDAESVYQGEYQEDLAMRKKELAAEIHTLELQAYRCTIEALHASGPLTWEKETMVTNLRMSLHISNDEHLVELKNLISSASSIRNR